LLGGDGRSYIFVLLFLHVVFEQLSGDIFADVEVEHLLTKNLCVFFTTGSERQRSGRDAVKHGDAYPLGGGRQCLLGHFAGRPVLCSARIFIAKDLELRQIAVSGDETCADPNKPPTSAADMI
jgi:hypothetical protein